MSRRSGVEEQVGWIRIMVAALLYWPRGSGGASVASVANATEEVVFKLMQPENVSLVALYNDVVPTYQVADWVGASPAAQRGKALVYSYLNFTDGPPPLSYGNLLNGNQNIIGLYRYNLDMQGQPQNERIEIKTGLGEEVEFFVAVHELLHFGGFGTVHASAWNLQVLEEARSRFISEFEGVASGDPVIGAHWESVSGTHVRAGRHASEEVMTPNIGGDAFLATSTLVACSRQIKGVPMYCDTDDDCEEGAFCTLGQSTTPGHCVGTAVDNTWPHTDTSNDAFVAILVSSLVVVVFVMIGIMTSWFEGTHKRYDKVPEAIEL